MVFRKTIMVGGLASTVALQGPSQGCSQTTSSHLKHVTAKHITADDNVILDDVTANLKSVGPSVLGEPEVTVPGKKGQQSKFAKFKNLGAKTLGKAFSGANLALLGGFAVSDYFVHTTFLRGILDWFLLAPGREGRAASGGYLEDEDQESPENFEALKNTFNDNKLKFMVDAFRPIGSLIMLGFLLSGIVVGVLFGLGKMSVPAWARKNFIMIMVGAGSVFVVSFLSGVSSFIFGPKMDNTAEANKTAAYRPKN